MSANVEFKPESVIIHRKGNHRLIKRTVHHENSKQYIYMHQMFGSSTSLKNNNGQNRLKVPDTIIMDDVNTLLYL